MYSFEFVVESSQHYLICGRFGRTRSQLQVSDTVSLYKIVHDVQPDSNF